VPQALIIGAAAGLASGALFVAPLVGPLSGLLVVNYFAQLPLLLAGLGLGALAGVVAAGGGLLVVVATTGIAGLVQFLIVYAVPATIVVRQSLLRHEHPDGTVAWYPAGHVLAILTGYGAVTFLAVMMLVDHPGGLEGLVRQMLHQGLTEIVGPALDQSRFSPDDLTRAAAFWATLFPGLVLMSWLTMVAVNAALAQAILSRAGRALRPSPRYSELELPRYLLVPLVVSGLLWAVGGGGVAFAGKTLTIAFTTPYFFLGLAAVHALSRGWTGRALVLFVFYLLLLFLIGWHSIAAVAVLGLVEQWTGFRRRMAAAADNEEER